MTYQILKVVRDWLAVEEAKARGGEYKEAIREAKMALVRLMKFL